MVGALELGVDALAQRMREELSRAPEPLRAARLHYDLGVLLERGELKPARAVEHYCKAAQLRPDHLPSLQAARRALCALGRHAEALPLFDAEQRLHASPAPRARLLYEKGRVLERLARGDEALSAYREGLALDAHDLDLLRAAVRCERRAQCWDALDATLAQLAQAIEQDPAWKAAVIAERARLADVRNADPARALELYVAALAIDPDVGGATEAIKRLGHAQGHWEQLLRVYEQEALRSGDPNVRADAGSRMAELLGEQLGDLERASAALQLASTERPDDRSLLERASELHAQQGAHAQQLAVLERLRALAQGGAERAALCIRMAELAEGPLADSERAESYYLDALAAEPGQRAALQALAALYDRRADHHGLLDVYARELETHTDTSSKAELLVRMGALWEVELNDPEQAAAHYARALGMQPDHDPALRGLDRLLPALGRFQELALAYEQMIDKLGDREQATVYLFRIGALYEDRLDEPKAALAAYARVLRLCPDHLGALHALQRAALRAGEHAQALSALRREATLVASPARAADLRVRAAELLAERLGDTKAAIVELEQLLAQHPEHPLANARLRALYRSEERWEGLIALLSRALERGASREAGVELALEIGQLYERRLGRLPDAVEAYNRALAAQPTHAAAFAALSGALRASGRWGELGAALQARAKVVAEAPERAQLYCELGRLCEQRLNDPARALEAYECALQAQPGSRLALDARARLLWESKDWKRLTKALHDEVAQSLEPRLSIAALERAAVLEAETLGDARTALATYAELLARAPHHVSALLAVEALGVAQRDHKELRTSYAAQAASTADERLKVAALRDLAAVLPSPDEAAAAYRELCALRGDDIEALRALAERARAANDGAAELALEARLAQAEGDREVAATHHLAIAARIEARDATQALPAYRTAFALDPESLLAARGLSRAAVAFALPQALTDAARSEARVTRDIGISVELLLHAAELRARSADFGGAAKDALHALELDPGSKRSAETLSFALTKAGQEAQLADALAHAAEATQDAGRRADLYTQVARLRAEHLHNLPAAVSAAERALASKPEHVPALLELARHLEGLGRWEQAAQAHERCASLGRDPIERAAALLAAATIVVERLHDAARAHQQLRAVLSAEPENRNALTLQAKLLAAGGKHGESLALLRKLVETAPDDTERVRCLLELARAEEREGHPERAEQALWEALALAGTDSVAERAYRERLGRHATHARYVDALQQHLSSQPKGGEDGARTLLAIARSWADDLGDRTQALAVLERGARAYPQDVALCVEHATRLTQAGNPDAAIARVRAQLALSPFRPELWQALSDAHLAAGRSAEGLSSALPLLALDTAAGEQRVSLRARKARPAGGPGLFDDTLVAELDPHGLLQTPAALLVQTLAPVVAKLQPLELASYGLTRRDRLPEDSSETVRLAADRVARMLGAPDCELYVHDQSGAAVELGLGEPSALLVPRSLLGKPKSQLVFALAQPLFCLRFELSAVAALPARELAVLLAGTVRRQQPSYGAGIASTDALDEASRAITKAVPWLSRKKVDEAAAALAEQGEQDLVQFCDGVKLVAARAALLLCDDLPGALELLRALDERPLERDPVASDLLQLWASETAVRYRNG